MTHQPGFRRRMLSLAVASAFACATGGADANGTGAQVVNGQATISSQGKTMTVVNSPGAIINWQSFSIARDETTIFQQQSAASAVLNRVVGQNPSQILGTLTSNGRVFLVNPNGMVFGRDAVISTNGFVASTLGLTDQNFKDALSRGEALRFANGGNAGAIQIDGQIKGNAGDVYLIAPQVSTSGTAIVSSQGGNVVLAAGETVEIKGRNLNDITFQVKGGENQAVNLGTLSGGAVGVFAGTLKHSGIVRATTLANEGGKIVLKAQGDVTLSAGSQTIADGATQGGSVRVESQAGNVTVGTGAQVSAQAPSGTGGTVELVVPAGIAGVESAARLSASGALGGTVSVGALKIAQEGTVEADGHAGPGGTITLKGERRIIQSASAQTSATGQTRGGNIVIAAAGDAETDGAVFTSGTIDAGASSGVGGKVRVSGRTVNFVASSVDASGDAGGGAIEVGGRRDNDDPASPNSQVVYANAAANFRASARRDGAGGSVTLWSDDTTTALGHFEARGGASSGNGGFLEVSGRLSTRFGGMADAGANRGAAGTFLIDPQYIVIQAPATNAGLVELVDPNPGSSNFFGSLTPIQGNGNLLVINPNDDFAAANSGAIYLFNGTTGALLSTLRGSTASDRIGNFGTALTLGNGSLLLYSPNWNGNAGAYTPYNTATGVSGTISAANSLVGATAGDRIGSGGFQFVVGGTRGLFSPQWNGGAGAITWYDTTNGMVGTVTAANSLVGSISSDAVASRGYNSLGSGNIAIVNPGWNGGAGAVTFINSSNLPTGPITASNSLIGATGGDAVGSSFQNLFNGKSIVFSPQWNGGFGAVTWYDNVNGTFGTVSSSNSLVGSSSGDQVGFNGLVNFFNGKGAIHSSKWNGNAGALTFVNGLTTGVTGVVSASNSLVGALPGDNLGSAGIQRLNNGNYVVISPNASIGGVSQTGAVTLFDGSAGTSGAISAANSLVGSNVGDAVGGGGVVGLGNSNFIVLSPSWNGGRGAATWASGTVAVTGTPGAITSAQGNSILGSTPGDAVGTDYSILGSGNFVILSPNWANTASVPNAGAVTFGFAASGFSATAPVSASNSFVGGSTGDQVGSGGIVNLQSGNYVVLSPNWSGGAGAVTFGDSYAMGAGAVGPADGRSLVGSAPSDAVGSGGVVDLYNTGIHFVVLSPNWNGNAGAVSWGDGLNGFTAPGAVSSANSFVGATAGDRVGSGGITHLSNGNYLIASPQWNGGAGAVSFAPGNTIVTGAIGAVDGRSILGATPADSIGSGGMSALNNGNYVILSPNWNNGAATQAGAVTFVDQNSGFVNPGFVGPTNSLVGTHAGDRVGSNGILLINSSANSNYLVPSPNYNSGAGAVTFASGNLPIFGPIGGETHGNSIWGAAPGDNVGANIQFLDYYYNYINYGHFVVISPNATNPAGNLAGAGAVTFGDMDTGFTNPGVVSSANSLIGSHAGDQLGSGGISRLYHSVNYSLSNYLVLSPNYNGGAGAVTWASGISPIQGTIGAESQGNSVFGSLPSDAFGSSGVEILGNNNFVVLSPQATNPAGGIAQAGAATFGTEASGFANPGTVSTANSLMGSNAGDQVGSRGVQSYLGGGLFAVFSPNWNGGIGAVTWGNESGGVTGAVSAVNSLVGSAPGDAVGNTDLTSLAGKLYVRNAAWGASRGAITYIDPAAPTTGVVSSANSLVGATANDNVGSGGIYRIGSDLIAVLSPNWSNGSASAAGAVTWGRTTLPQYGLTGVISPSNSLVGTTASDQVGSGFPSLVSGSSTLYVLKTPNWDNGTAANTGAITWINTAAAPPVGAVSASNSLIGAAAGDQLGASTSFYSNFSTTTVMRNGGGSGFGAATWINTSAPVTGVLSAANSLVGAGAGDQVGSGGVGFLSNGNFYVLSPQFATGAGAVTIGSMSGGITGVVSSANSLVGQVSGDGIGNSVQQLSGNRLLVTASSADSGGFTNNGRVFVYSGGGASGGSGSLGSQLYTDIPSASVTITPGQITAITSTGTNVVLQANTDITLAPGSDIVTTPSSGNGGGLTLQAGRSVKLGSNIVTANGNVRIDANDSGANPAYRAAGLAEIIMTEGTRIDAGTGRVEFYLHGPTAQGDIAVRSITAGSLVLQNDLGGVQVGARNASIASDLLIAGSADVIAATRISFIGGNGSARALLSANGQITIDPPQLVMQNGTTPEAFAKIVNPSQQFPIRLVISDCLGCVTVSPYELTGQNLLLTQVFTSGIPINTLLQKVLDTVVSRPEDKKNKGDIEVEATDVCK